MSLYKFPCKKHLQLKVELSQFLLNTMGTVSTKDEED